MAARTTSTAGRRRLRSWSVPRCWSSAYLLRTYGLHSHGLNRYDSWSYGLRSWRVLQILSPSFLLNSYDLHSDGLHSYCLYSYSLGAGGSTWVTIFVCSMRLGYGLINVHVQLRVIKPPGGQLIRSKKIAYHHNQQLRLMKTDFLWQLRVVTIYK